MTIKISDSVGRNGRNFPTDVAVIVGALVAIGPARGGVGQPPLGIGELGDAIERFQRFHTLPLPDGLINKGKTTLKKIDSLLSVTPGPSDTLTLTRMDISHLDLGVFITKETLVPVETSLRNDLVFEWDLSPNAIGLVTYFRIEENVVPKYFGVLTPYLTSSYDRAHIFFHPTPSQNGQNPYVDSTYFRLGNWYKIFHYLSDIMARQFLAAGTGRVMIMPLMNNASAETCGIFPERWRELCEKMLGMIAAENYSGSAAPVPISNVVVSSFSSGITYSHFFRQRANLGSALTGLIDFDGTFSTYRSRAHGLTGPAGRTVQFTQQDVKEEQMRRLADRNIFTVSLPRWGKYKYRKQVANSMILHGEIPQRMMYLGSKIAG